MFKVSSFHKNSRLISFFVVILAAVSFVGFGFVQYAFDDQSQVMAVVDGHEINSYEFDLAYRRFENAYRNQGIPAATMRQFVFQYLLGTYVSLSRAKDLYFDIGEEVLSDIIRSQFMRDGEFSYEAYMQFLSENFYTDASYEQDLRKSYLQRLVIQHDAFLLSGLTEESGFQRIEDAYFAKRSIDLVMLDQSYYAEVVSVSEQEARVYYQNNQSKFNTPDQAMIEYVEFSYDEFVLNSKYSDQEIMAYYKKYQHFFNQPEQRKAWYVIFNDANHVLQSSEFLKQIQQGESIEQLFKRPLAEGATFEASPVWFAKDDISFVGHDVLYSMAIEDAQVFQEGGKSYFLQLTDIQKAYTSAFDSVKETVKTALMKEKWANHVREVVEFNEQSASLAMLSSKYGKESQHTGFFSLNDDQGATSSDAMKYLRVREFALSQEVLDIPAPILFDDDNRLIFLQKTAHQASQQQTFFEVQEQVVAIVKAQKIEEMLQQDLASMASTLDFKDIQEYKSFLFPHAKVAYSGAPDQLFYESLTDKPHPYFDQFLLDQIRLMPFSVDNQVHAKVLQNLESGQHFVVVLKTASLDEPPSKAQSLALESRVDAIYGAFFADVWRLFLSKSVPTEVKIGQ